MRHKLIERLTDQQADRKTEAETGTETDWYIRKQRLKMKEYFSCRELRARRKERTDSY